MRQKHEPIPWKRGLIAILAALAVSALCCGLLSLLTLGEKIPLEGAKTAAPILSALSLFAACYYTVLPQRQQKLLIALGVGAVYVAALFLLHQWAAPQEAVALDLRLAALAVAAAGAGLLASKTPRRTRR